MAPRMRKLALNLLAAATTFAAVFGALTALDGTDRPPAAAASPPRGEAPRRATTDARIASLQRTLRAGGDGQARAYGALAELYLQKARETGDTAFYSRAEGAIRAGRRLAPRDAGLAVSLSTLELARHDFRAALRHAQEARRLEPQLVQPYAPLVDALVELGRYEEAGRRLQEMVDLKPSVASYARVSYFRELHGDLPGAVEAMELAVSAGAARPENAAYVQTLLGDLHLTSGRRAAAEEAYRTALRSFPGHVSAEAGLARAAAARGDLHGAIRRYRRVVTRLPLPEHAIELGELELAAGREAAAREHFALVRAQQALLARAGVDTDVELAPFEADHGSPRRALTLARRGWRTAPSVRAADSLGWALTRAGRPAQGLRYGRRALALGSRDPLFLYHAGMSARATGRRGEARRYLRRALDANPRFSPLHAPRARRALRDLA